MIYNAFIQAIREIKRNFMRSLLTTLGIVIGIASVISMVNIGKGVSESITKKISSLGSDILYIMPKRSHDPDGGLATYKAFKKKDLEILRDSILTLSAISPVRNQTMTTIYKNKNYLTEIKGVNNDYFKIKNLSLIAGRIFEHRELKIGQNICILGKTVVDELFTFEESPIGKKVRLENFSCEVVGILKEMGTNTFGENQDDVVLVPIRMFQRRISGNNNIHLIMATVKENIPFNEAKSQIDKLLREIRHIEDDENENFSIQDMTNLIGTITQITSMLTVMLGAIAAISLIVGGIGIMNIMLVSVTQRTREIGTRMATGAMSGDILTQFLIEAIVLSGFGGIIGMLLGFTITYIVSITLLIPLVIDPSITIIALISSMLIGIIFGILPAKKAANLNPIDALRYE